MRTRVFKNPEVLHEMLTLRLQGWSLGELAFKYQCDKSNVMKACVRNGLPRQIVLLPKPVVSFRKVVTDWNGERINQGKTYQEYMEEEKRKRQLSVLIVHSSL